MALPDHISAREKEKFLEDDDGNTAVRISGEVLLVDANGTSIIDSNGNVPVTSYQKDSTTNSVVTIDYSHHEIHGGSHYAIRSYEPLAKNATKDILISVPNTTKWPHVTFGVGTSVSVAVAALYEGTTTSADGTSCSAFNRSRNSASTNTTVCYEDPTVSAAGTMLYETYVGTDRKVGGAVRDNEEVILKQNTKYLLRITEQNVNPTVIEWLIDWYEHIDE